LVSLAAVSPLRIMIVPIISALAGCVISSGSGTARDGSTIETAIIIAPPPNTADAREWAEIKKRFPDARPLKTERPRLEWRTTSELAYRGHIIDPRTFATSHGPRTMYFDVTSAVTAY
jgi:hypothetical protein